MNKLLYTKPARLWRDALPVGNGLTGVMIYGGKTTETLCFNDSSLWSGYPKDYNSSKSLEYLDEVRQLIFDGKNSQADALAEEKLCGFYTESYMPLGTVKLKINGAKPFAKYSRALDLSTGVHTVDAGNIKRDCFASYPDKLVCYNMQSDNAFSVIVSTESKLQNEIVVDNGLSIIGNAPDYAAPNYLGKIPNPIVYDEQKGMAFALCVKADTDGTVSYQKDKMLINNAKRLTLYFATETGFKAYDEMPESNRRVVLNKCKQKLENGKGYDEIKKNHIADFNSVFSKSTVSFAEENDIPTVKLLAIAKKNGVSSSLAELFYNYGKYLIVSGSRAGGQALNLQGIWNDSLRPPWSSNYTVNINTQMNYWGLSRANLVNCSKPYLDLVWETMQNGKKTAEINYGCEGFACNHNVDLWRKTPPVQGCPNYMLEPLCGVWLSNEIYSHYKNGLYNSDEDKQRVFEIVKESALFASSYLVMHDGKYVVCPSASPENSFCSDEGKKCSLDYASAFDMALVRQSFNNYLDYEKDDELTKKINSIIPDLWEFKCGENGILEYHKDYKMPERGHRHMSPLYAFYPANVVKYYENEEQRKWVKKLFDDRIAHTHQYIGWSAAWGICLAGRLHDKENAKMIIDRFLNHSVFKNLFSVHPPHLFQIDGNLGYVAGVHELLVYEENGYIELLPALPDCYANGKVNNLLVNGAELSFEWKNNKIISVSSNNPVRIMSNNFAENVELGSNVTID